MKSIRVFDKDINLLAEIDNYESIDITRRFYKTGEFELKIKASKLHTDKLFKNNLLLVGKNFNKVGIILHREFSGEDNSDFLIVKGCLLQGILGRRLIIPDTQDSYMSFKGSQEYIIKSFIEMNCINPNDLKRKISRLTLAENKNRGREDSWRSSYENLGDKLSEIAEYSGLGLNISLDIKNKSFVFDIIEPKDLTINQNILPPVIFRNDFNNIKTRKYTESIINSKNVAYSGIKEDSSKLVLSVGNTSDFERIETFVDCNDEDIDEITKAGNVILKELEELKTFEIDVRHNNTFIYEKDYDLGDIVTIQDKKLKVTMDSKIVEVKETYTPKTFDVKLTFGKSIPSLLTTIKRAVK